MVHLMTITEIRLLVQEIKTVTFHSKVCVLYGRVRNGACQHMSYNGYLVYSMHIGTQKM